MKTTSVKEPDILSVINELESRAKLNAPDSEPEKLEAPDPQELLASLKAKEKCLDVIGGYANKKDIAEMKDSLKAAIEDLEKIIELTQ